MGLFGPDRKMWQETEVKTTNAANLHHREEKRKRKLERQEKRAKKLSEPLLPWLCRAFRVLTIAATAAFAVLEIHACATASNFGVAVSDPLRRVFFSAFTSWTVLGAVWFFSCLAQIHVLKKKNFPTRVETPPADRAKEILMAQQEERLRGYRVSAIQAVAGWGLLGLLYFMFVLL